MERAVEPSVMNGVIFRVLVYGRNKLEISRKITKLDRVRKEKEVMRKPRVRG